MSGEKASENLTAASVGSTALLASLAGKPPTWPERGVPDMRRKHNKELLKLARHSGHVKQIYVATSGFTGCRKAWQFSNELLAAECAQAKARIEANK